MKKGILVIAAAASTAAFWPAASGAATFRGIVVAKERGVLLAASPGGLVRALAGRAPVGSQVVSAGGRLRVVGRVRTARIHGVVIRRTGTTMFVSSNRHLLALRTPRVLASASATASPQPGDVVTSQVTIDENGRLNDDDNQDAGNVSAAQVSATVAAVAAASITLTVQGQPLTVQLPAGLTLPSTLVGQAVIVRLSFAGDAETSDANDTGDEQEATAMTVVAPGDHHGGDDDDADPDR
jgi:hypothetical protein